MDDDRHRHEDPLELLWKVEAASAARDLFGKVSPDTLDEAKQRHRGFMVALHPDRVAVTGIPPKRAAAAFAKEASLFTTWVQLAERNAERTSDRNARRDSGATEDSPLGPLVARGSVANVYRYDMPDSTAPTVIKVARSGKSAAFISNERAALRRLAEFTDASADCSGASTTDNSWLAPYYPKLREGMTVEFGGGERREANVLDALTIDEGFFTLDQVRKAYPRGLDGRDWAWMQRRLLRAVAGAHEAGLVHGAILPENVLIHPRLHGVVLTGWSFAGPPGGPLPGIVAPQRFMYPPEATSEACYATDVYMLGKLAQWMLEKHEWRHRQFAEKSLHHDPRIRPSARKLLDDYDDFLDRTHGPRRFRHFTMTRLAP